MFFIICFELGKNFIRKGFEKWFLNYRIIWMFCGEEINVFCFWVIKVDMWGKNFYLRFLIILEIIVFID